MAPQRQPPVRMVGGDDCGGMVGGVAGKGFLDWWGGWRERMILAGEEGWLYQEICLVMVSAAIVLQLGVAGIIKKKLCIADEWTQCGFWRDGIKGRYVYELFDLLQRMMMEIAASC